MDPHNPRMWVNTRGDIVVCDILEMPPSRDGYNELLVFCDNLSRFVEAIPFRSLPTAEEVLDAFVEHVFCRYGTPSVLRSDRGSNLIAKLSQEFYELCGVKLETSTSHHHKGLPSVVERFHSTLLGLSRASAGGHPGDWVDMLPFVLFTTRCSQSAISLLECRRRSCFMAGASSHPTQHCRRAVWKISPDGLRIPSVPIVKVLCAECV